VKAALWHQSKVGDDRAGLFRGRTPQQLGQHIRSAIRRISVNPGAYFYWELRNRLAAATTD
jgi:hypothetical protein